MQLEHAEKRWEGRVVCFSGLGFAEPHSELAFELHNPRPIAPSYIEPKLTH